MSAQPAFEALVEAVAAVAARWREPDYEPRAEASAQTLTAPNRFTGEALAFAVNQQMHQLTPEALRAWIGERRAGVPRRVGVLNAGNLPLVGLQDFLAVVLVGHPYVGTRSSKSPYLLPAFVAELREEVPGLDAAFAEADALFARAEAVLATGTDETRAWAADQCAAHGIPPERRLLRGHRYAAAVLGGRETEAELEGLAEDALLHEGLGCRNVAVVWAPAGTSPDGLLEALAHFRSVFPPHPETPGTLKMQQAFLAAVEQPHAYGDGLEFLVSKGPPEPQQPGHLRWTEYAALGDAGAWIEAERDALQLIVARPDVAAHLPASVPYVAPGEAQRPPLAWHPDGRDTVAFLAGLG